MARDALGPDAVSGQPYQVVPVDGARFAISDEEALRLAIAHTLLRNGKYRDGHELRQDIILWLVWLGKSDYIPTEWYRQTVWVASQYGVDIPAEVTARQAAYYDQVIHNRIARGESLTQIQAELTDWILSRAKASKSAPNYSAMIHRESGGSDPLVREPGP